METTTTNIVDTLNDRIADLNKVINTLTEERDRLVSAVEKLDDKPVKIQRIRKQHRRSQRRDDHAINGAASKKDQILQLNGPTFDMTPTEIADELGINRSYVYLVLRSA